MILTQQNPVLNTQKQYFTYYVGQFLKYIHAELRKRKMSGKTRIAPICYPNTKERIL